MFELTPFGGLFCLLVMAGLLTVEAIMVFSLLLEELAKRYSNEMADNLYMMPDVDALTNAAVPIESESLDRREAC
jgi:hypothetical protein